MSKLNEYIEKIKKYKKENPNLTEEELIMYIYLDLGLKFKFDQNFFFAGNSEKRRIYENSRRIDELEKCVERNIVICRNSAYLMQYVLRELGINITTVTDPEDTRKFPHVYNVIKPKSGGEEYSIDLQEDMIYMHYHAFPKSFGLSTDGAERYVISRKEQEKMHRKFGYLSDKNPYVDEYIYLFKQDVGMFDDFQDKVDFILKNIDPIDYPKVDYWERRWKHERFLRELLSRDEISKLNVVEFYKKRPDGTKEFINGFFVDGKKGVIVYLYSKENNCYESYTVQEFAKKVEAEDISYLQKVKGLNKELAKLKSEKEK